jgi:hypothetical protein
MFRLKKSPTEIFQVDNDGNTKYLGSVGSNAKVLKKGNTQAESAKNAGVQTAAREQAKLDAMDAKNKKGLEFIKQQKGIEQQFKEKYPTGEEIKREGLAKAGLDSLNTAIDLMDKDKSIVSGLKYSKASKGLTTQLSSNPNLREAEAQISNATANLIYARSGAQINEQEFQRMERAINPLWADNEKDFIKRLDIIKNGFKSLQRNPEIDKTKNTQQPKSKLTQQSNNKYSKYGI